MASVYQLVLLSLALAATVTALLSERPFVHQKKTVFPEERFSKLSEQQYQALLQHLASRHHPAERTAAFAPRGPADFTFRRAIQNILMKKYRNFVL
ncbi:hypothetical protein QR680_017372 [Steinernema hermaphroditum]|uniref:Uncharacterized protein n=1 Tax=Steinernema hermaphroditum TaxID=289476 RepID=A0AA39HGP2_9BILA|nr:hypothetical protein QR680_017372 [Steinernema hermaphroditum]